MFEQAEIAKFNAKELKDYEESMNAYHDIVNAINTAKKDSFAEGIEKGRAEGVLTTARNLLSLNVDTATIAKATGLSEEEINRLR